MDNSEVIPLQTKCRLYENKYPDIGELVVVRVTQVDGMGAYVKLIEYDNVEGMILLSELTRNRIRSVRKVTRVGNLEIAAVIRKDEEKGCIDLTKKGVSKEETTSCEERYNKSKTVYSMIHHLSENFKRPVLELYESIVWPLAKKFGHAYDAFRYSIENPSSVFGDLKIEKDIYDELFGTIQRKLTPSAMKIRASVEVTCFGYDGILAIKAALSAGDALKTPEQPLEIKLSAAPLFNIFSSTTDFQKGLEFVTKVIATIESEIAKRGGKLVVKEEPHTTTSEDSFSAIKTFSNADDDDDNDDDQSGDSEDEPLDKIEKKQGKK